MQPIKIQNNFYDVRVYYDEVYMTIDKVGGSVNSKHAEIFGKSTEIKPTDAGINDLYIELDTGECYYWDGSTWSKVGG